MSFECRNINQSRICLRDMDPCDPTSSCCEDKQNFTYGSTPSVALGSVTNGGGTATDNESSSGIVSTVGAFISKLLATVGASGVFFGGVRAALPDPPVRGPGIAENFDEIYIQPARSFRDGARGLLERARDMQERSVLVVDGQTPADLIAQAHTSFAEAVDTLYRHSQAHDGMRHIFSPQETTALRTFDAEIRIEYAESLMHQGQYPEALLQYSNIAHNGSIPSETRTVAVRDGQIAHIAIAAEEQLLGTSWFRDLGPTDRSTILKAVVSAADVGKLLVYEQFGVLAPGAVCIPTDLSHIPEAFLVHVTPQGLNVVLREIKPAVKKAALITIRTPSQRENPQLDTIESLITEGNYERAAEEAGRLGEEALRAGNNSQARYFFELEAQARITILRSTTAGQLHERSIIRRRASIALENLAVAWENLGSAENALSASNRIGLELWPSAGERGMLDHSTVNQAVESSLALSTYRHLQFDPNFSSLTASQQITFVRAVARYCKGVSVVMSGHTDGTPNQPTLTSTGIEVAMASQPKLRRYLVVRLAQNILDAEATSPVTRPVSDAEFTPPPAEAAPGQPKRQPREAAVLLLGHLDRQKWFAATSMNPHDRIAFQARCLATVIEELGNPTNALALTDDGGGLRYDIMVRVTEITATKIPKAKPIEASPAGRAAAPALPEAPARAATADGVAETSKTAGVAEATTLRGAEGKVEGAPKVELEGKPPEAVEREEKGSFGRGKAR